jgi:hypothetical protein
MRQVAGCGKFAVGRRQRNRMINSGRESQVDFGGALHAMKDGKGVWRTVWGTSRENWYGACMRIVEIGAPYEPQIMVEYRDSEVKRPFAGSQWDLLADDWEIVRE